MRTSSDNAVGTWGKLARSGGEKAGPVEEWHPLVDHCADVAACAEALLSTTILGQRLARFAGWESLDTCTIARLSLLAALHDLGKSNLGFQRRGDEEPRDTAGHVQEVLDLLGSRTAAARELHSALGFLGGWGPSTTLGGLLAASISHHGRPLKAHPGAVRAELWAASGRRDPVATMRGLVAAARSWFPEAEAAGARPLPSSTAFQHAFEGLVMLADWIGSDRALFPFSEATEDRMPFARAQARAALRDLGLDAGGWRDALGDRAPGFDRVSPFPAREAQAALVNLPVHAGGSLTILESETGSGKTEAALARFLVLFQAGLVDGMTFALPTRTAATQLHRRVVAALRRAFGATKQAPPVVLAVPGYLRVDDVEGRRLPQFEVLWDDDPRAANRHRGWAAESAKRFLAGAVVVGTIDQVLLSALRVGHAHLRATALLRHLLVVDEVHASDAYMTRILEEVLRFHAQAGGHALLMSATLGTTTRMRLARAVGTPDEDDEADLAAAVSAPYPAIHDAAVGFPLHTVAIGAPGLPKSVEIEVAPQADSPEEVAEAALAAARRGARVLVLRNTVRDAVATQIALEALVDASPGDENLLLHAADARAMHHARFARDDRALLDDAVEARLGAAATTTTQRGCVVVATQTVQQALDLDADWMLTDLAPMDVLLQRLGRVHRHRARDPHRPDGFQQPRARVLVSPAPLDESLRADGTARGAHGVGTVYDDLLVLQTTLELLTERRTLRIPEDNRELVERTTHPDALRACAERLGAKWAKHASVTLGLRLAERSVGALGLVDRKERLGEYTFSDLGAEERISTRLGEGDRRIVFPSKPAGPFGAPVREITLTAWMVKGLDESCPEEVTPTSVEAGVVRFDWGGGGFVYDRMGVRRDE